MAVRWDIIIRASRLINRGFGMMQDTRILDGATRYRFALYFLICPAGVNWMNSLGNRSARPSAKLKTNFAFRTIF
jgi:hypothetical protein